MILQEGGIYTKDAAKEAIDLFDTQIASVNEPAILFTMIIGLGGLFSLRRYKK